MLCWLAVGLFSDFGKSFDSCKGYDHSRKCHGFRSLSGGIGLGVGESVTTTLYLCSSRCPRRRLQGKPCAEDGAKSNLRHHNFILDDGVSGRSKSLSSHEAGSFSDSKCVKTVTLGIAWRMSASMLSNRR